MTDANNLKNSWIETRNRLVAKALLGGSLASLSVRCPNEDKMWFGLVTDEQPVLVDRQAHGAGEPASLHAATYKLRGDVGAIALGAGAFGALMAGFNGMMPQLFDEQARHIGPMPQPIDRKSRLESALRPGGNVLLWGGLPLCLGITYTRLALNAELFEKCAKAYVLAAATGGRIKSLPWWVRRIANGRLAKDQARAQAAFARGELPTESRGY
ncbi:hypothetical protein KQ940_10460 [Marinobacterium sp. D7]|uniref:hypothetical protein n=1 Tax=Marinobacterium ramblicola TaxID=2849041 RepID=UPI001C2DA3E2|nr:hypothetical protein [Marinobacterium ramblicola]MBV1788479.1 hypothetical protein [Marinobacterium ramblicola]